MVNFLINQPPMLTMEELCRGKGVGSKENLADFWLMASAKSPASLPSEAPCRKGGFDINFGVAKETGPQGASGGKTQAIAGAAMMGTDGGDNRAILLGG